MYTKKMIPQVSDVFTIYCHSINLCFILYVYTRAANSSNLYHDTWKVCLLLFFESMSEPGGLRPSSSAGKGQRMPPSSRECVIGPSGGAELSPGLIIVPICLSVSKMTQKGLILIMFLGNVLNVTRNN